MTRGTCVSTLSGSWKKSDSRFPSSPFQSANVATKYAEMMESTILELEKCLVFKKGRTHIKASFKCHNIDEDVYKFSIFCVSITDACAGETKVQGTV